MVGCSGFDTGIRSLWVPLCKNSSLVYISIPFYADVHTSVQAHTYTHTYMYMYVYIYMYMHVCLYVYVSIYVDLYMLCESPRSLQSQ